MQAFDLVIWGTAVWISVNPKMISGHFGSRYYVVCTEKMKLAILDFSADCKSEQAKKKICTFFVIYAGKSSIVHIQEKMVKKCKVTYQTYIRFLSPRVVYLEKKIMLMSFALYM